MALGPLLPYRTRTRVWLRVVRRLLVKTLGLAATPSGRPAVAAAGFSVCSDRVRA